jgi:hypothetical protein
MKTISQLRPDAKQYEFTIKGKLKNTSAIQAKQDILDLLGKDFERYCLFEVFTEECEITEKDNV